MSRCFYPQLNLSLRHLIQGGVLAYPTEAVWGLGCDPFNHHAIETLLQLKQRPVDKGLILVAADIGQFEFILFDLELTLRKKLESSWPGHVTWLVPHHQRVSSLVSGRHHSVALRVSQHPVVRALCHQFGGPLVSTSANPQNLAPAKTQLRARCYFGKAVVYAPGTVGKQLAPSQIKDLLSDKVLRG